MQPLANLAFPDTLAPMEARLVSELPAGPEWQFEPKWDGFRCLAFRDGDRAALTSKSGKPLARYFPEIVADLLELADDRLVLDGELVLPVGDALSFADLQLRLHPAASRIARLSRENPARLMLFDCLQRGDAILADQDLTRRRAELEALASAGLPDRIRISPVTADASEARRWLAASGGALDGIVAKRRDEPYRSGERAMAKFKVRRTADCVVGGYRTDPAGKSLASLLLGLFDSAGRLHHVGFVSGLTADQRTDALLRVQACAGPSPFDGSAPGGPSRWSGGRSTEWHPVRAELVVEVGYDQVTGDRLRHAASFLRWRPDKAPGRCNLDQLQGELSPDALESRISG